MQQALILDLLAPRPAALILQSRAQDLVRIRGPRGQRLGYYDREDKARHGQRERIRVRQRRGVVHRLGPVGGGQDVF